MTLPAHDTPILLFDGECALCSGWVRFVLKRERASVIRFAAAQGEAGQKLLGPLGLPHTDWDSHFLIEDGKIHFKSDAEIAVAAHLGGAWPYARVLRAVPRPVRDWIYDRIARNRYTWFGRIPYCAAPGGGDPSRFLA